MSNAPKIYVIYIKKRPYPFDVPPEVILKENKEEFVALRSTKQFKFTSSIGIKFFEEITLKAKELDKKFLKTQKTHPIVSN